MLALRPWIRRVWYAPWSEATISIEPFDPLWYFFLLSVLKSTVYFQFSKIRKRFFICWTFRITFSLLLERCSILNLIDLHVSQINEKIHHFVIEKKKRIKRTSENIPSILFAHKSATFCYHINCSMFLRNVHVFCHFLERICNNFQITQSIEIIIHLEQTTKSNGSREWILYVCMTKSWKWFGRAREKKLLFANY